MMLLTINVTSILVISYLSKKKRNFPFCTHHSILIITQIHLVLLTTILLFIVAEREIYF